MQHKTIIISSAIKKNRKGNIRILSVQQLDRKNQKKQTAQRISNEKRLVYWSEKNCNKKLEERKTWR